MWSDELHKKMEEAENNNDSSNHEKAWEKMELLLDEHLPVKKKRRRFIFLLFPLLLGGCIALFFLQKRGDIDQSVSQQGNTTAVTPNTTAITPPENTPSGKTISPTKPSGELTTIQTAPESRPDQQDQPKINDDLIQHKTATNKPTKEIIQREQYLSSKKTTRKKVSPKNQQQHDISDGKPIEPKVADAIANNTEEKTAIEKIVRTLPDTNLTVKTPIADSSKTKTDTTTDNTKETVKKVTKKTSSFNKNLSFSFSFGPDISSVGIDRPGKLGLPYGVGVSYALSKNISIRTGFFVGKKIYDADSADYHPPSNFWSYYSNLQKIDANCLVYEIPVSVVYNFAADKKHNWFVSGGLSSYLMKKEEYEYYYKNSWGQPQLYQRTYKNENSHFFSVLNLSGGYKYSLSDRVSLMGEPYVKIPVSGVGYGKVKLNSAGIMFTVSVKPFLKKN